jgi:uncharacterized LabA/DUF88 family protein
MYPSTAFLVDADFFIRQVRYHEGPPKTEDPILVAGILRRHCIKHLYWKRAQHGRLYRIFVYDCPPLLKKAHYPRSRRAVDFAKSDVARFRMGFHDALRRMPNIALRLGYLDEGNAEWQLRDPKKLAGLWNGTLDPTTLTDADFVYYARQKAVDMKLGLDIASLAYKRLVQRIVLIAGDSDFVPAAKMARREGIEFVLDPMWKVIRPDLQEHVDVVRTTIPKKQPDAAGPTGPASGSESDALGGT